MGKKEATDATDETPEEKEEEMEPQQTPAIEEEKKEGETTQQEQAEAATAETQENGDKEVNNEVQEGERPRVNDDKPIASISVTNQPVKDKDHTTERPKLDKLDIHTKIPAALENLPSAVEAGGSLTERLERALGSVAPLLREIFVDFAPFLSKTLIGSHGQELLIGGECQRKKGGCLLSWCWAEDLYDDTVFWER